MICDKLGKKKLIGSIIALTVIAHVIIHLTLSWKDQLSKRF